VTEQKRKLSDGWRSLIDRTHNDIEQYYARQLSDEDVFEIIHSLKSYSQVLLDIHADTMREAKNES
jgi:predicted CopG family antitoxin